MYITNEISIGESNNKIISFSRKHDLLCQMSEYSVVGAGANDDAVGGEQSRDLEAGGSATEPSNGNDGATKRYDVAVYE